MKLRKILLTLLALTMALGIFAACGEETTPPPATTYTVTFRDGETDIDSVTVNAGAALTAEQIPATPSGHDGTFLGWYVGSEKVTAGYTPAASVVALATFDDGAPAAKYTVTVVSGDYTVGGLKAEYVEGEEVIFTVTPTATDKEVDQVTSADVTVQKALNGSFYFNMPAKNVSVAVTLKPKQNVGPIEQTDDRIQLFMYGDLYKLGNVSSLRSIYAKLDGISGQFQFESLDPNIVGISEQKPQQGNDMPEAYLVAKAAGTTTIRCRWVEDPTVYNEMEVTVLDPKDGTSMPTETYGKIEGSVRLESVDELLDFDPTYQATASTIYDITTIFEEMEDESADNEFVDDNLTDAYQIDVVNRVGTTGNFSQKYVSNGRNVCTERVQTDNTVKSIPVFLEDDAGYSEKVVWANSAYTNIFHARPSCTSPDLWKSFDGGETYHFVGPYTAAQLICLFLYQANITPDDMYFEIDGEDIKLTVIIDPSSYKDSQKFGRKIETTFSEFGTATIEHVQPFEHESFHDTIATAQTNMAALKNYKAVITFDGKTYELTYLEDTIDVVVKTGTQITSHSGAHKYGDGEGDGKTYFEYTYDDEKSELVKGEEHDTVWHDGETVTRYPTFVFAPEIFGQTAQDKTYISRIQNGEFIKETCYLTVIPSVITMWDFCYDGTLKLDSSEQYIEEVSTTVKILGDEDPISIVFSEFGTATLDIQFDQAVTPTEPTTWQEGEERLYGKLKEEAAWQDVIELLPYVYVKEGFDSTTYQGSVQKVEPTSDYSDASYIKTNQISDEAEVYRLIAAYEAALAAKGWAKSAMHEKLEDQELEEGRYIYTLEHEGTTYMVSVGAYIYWNGKATALRITMYTPVSS